MKAEEVRAHLATLIVGQPKLIELGPYDTPKAVRNYFLVIAKLEGYVISTRQHQDNVLVTLTATFVPDGKKSTADGINGYYRKNKAQDFCWPAITLQNVEGMIELASRIDLSPKPRAGIDSPSPRSRKEHNYD